MSDSTPKIPKKVDVLRSDIGILLSNYDSTCQATAN